MDLFKIRVKGYFGLSSIVTMMISGMAAKMVEEFYSWSPSETETPD